MRTLIAVGGISAGCASASSIAGAGGQGTGGDISRCTGIVRHRDGSAVAAGCVARACVAAVCGDGAGRRRESAVRRDGHRACVAARLVGPIAVAA